MSNLPASANNSHETTFPVHATVRYQRTLVILLFAHIWLASSVFKEVQIAVELILGFWLGYLFLQNNWLKHEWLLVGIYVVSMLAAVMTTDFAVALLNAKIMGLAVLSILVFSKYRFDLTLSLWILGINSLIVAYQALFNGPPFVDWMMSNVANTFSGSINSRPPGLFMSVHYSATLVALYFIFLSRKSRVFFLFGGLLLAGHRSFFNLFSFVGQMVYEWLALLRLKRVLYLLLLVAAIAAIVLREEIITIDLTAYSDIFTRREQLGFEIIGEQIFNIDSYLQAFTFIPADSKALAANVFAGSDAGNELQYFTILQQGGLVLAVYYLWMLFLRVNGFQFFLVLSLFHYGAATVPIAIYLMLQFSMRMHKKLEKYEVVN